LFTVHDEVVTEIATGESNLSEFSHLMSVVPKWATGCPIAVDAYQSDRYRK
jgi:hypothetical protein